MDYRQKASEARERRGQVCDKAAAVVALAEQENRSISSEEQLEIDNFLAEGDKLAAEIDRLDKLATFQDSIAASRGKPQFQAAASASNEQSQDRPRSFIVPAKARFIHSSLRAFRGQSAESQADAYLTGQFLLATLGQNDHAKRWCADHGVDTRFYGAMTGDTNTLGGYVVPEEMERRIVSLREERGVMRANARIVPMSSDTLNIPRRNGGITVYFVGQNSEITASDPTLNQVQLSVKKMAALVKYSSEVSEDAVISMADFITSEIGYGFADKEDECGFNGDGTSTYGGIVGVKNALAAGSKVTAITGNTAFGTLDLDDFHSMVGKLPLYALQNAKWYISRAGWAASMQRLAEAAGGNTTANIEGGVRPLFLGHPVVWVQVMNSTLSAQTSTDGLCYFGDLSQGVAFGSRRGLSLAQSADRYFELDQLAIRGTQRFDIVVHEKGTASAAGSIVMLSTPAS